MEDIKKINLYGKDYNLGFSTEDFTTSLKNKLENLDILFLDIPDEELLSADNRSGEGSLSGSWLTFYNTLHNKYDLLDSCSIQMIIKNGEIFVNIPLGILSNGDGTLFFITFTYNTSEFKKTVSITLDNTNYSWESKIVHNFTLGDKDKLTSIESGALVNKIERINLNGLEITIVNKSVNLGDLLKKLIQGVGIKLESDGTISVTLDSSVFVILEALPTTPESGNTHKIHVIPSSTRGVGNDYEEYLWIGEKWELIGGFSASVDLSNYYTKTQTDSKIAEEIAKIPTPDVTAQISTHNTSGTAHSDIRTSLNNKADKTVVSTTLNGLMSKEDKAKLDEIHIIYFHDPGITGTSSGEGSYTDSTEWLAIYDTILLIPPATLDTVIALFVIGNGDLNTAGLIITSLYASSEGGPITLTGMYTDIADSSIHVVQIILSSSGYKWNNTILDSKTSILTADEYTNLATKSDDVIYFIKG